MNNFSTQTLLSFNTHSGKLVIDPSEIAYCEAQGSYTVICRMNGKKSIISKNLKAMSDFLDEFDFIRVHSGHIVNRNNIKSYDKHYSQITLTNDNILPVSRRKAGALRMISKNDLLVQAAV
jgi:two-component system, LytTR family, response regulator